MSINNIIISYKAQSFYMKLSAFVVIYCDEQMMLNQESRISDPLLGALGGISEVSPGDRCVLSSLYGSSSAFLLAKAYIGQSRSILVVLPTLEEAEEFKCDLDFFLGSGEAIFFPPTERLAFEESFTHPELMARRLEFLYKLTKKENFIAVTTTSTLIERVIPKSALKSAVFTLKVGGDYPRDRLLENFLNAGYTRVSMVEERGEVSVRGAIIDIFPPMHKEPLRIEFFADEIESIREFDPSTQRSTKIIDSITVLPAREGVISTGSRGEARARLAERAEELRLDRKAWAHLSDALRDGITIPALAPLLPYYHSTLDSLFDYLPLARS